MNCSLYSCKSLCHSLLIPVTLIGLLVYVFLFNHRNHLTNHSMRKNVYNFSKTELLDSCDLKINIYFQFVDAKKQPKLQDDFLLLTSSMFSRTNCLLHLFIITDEFGIKWAEDVFSHFKEIYPWFVFPKRSYYRIENFISILSRVTKPMKELFSGIGNFYSKSLFHIVPAIHRVLPEDLDRLIILDLDMKFEADIKELYLIYDEMNKHLMGLSSEQSPVYYHITTEYREKNISTTIGKPPPYGKPGFNGGVKLFRLNVIRNNVLYNSYLDSPVKLSLLANKYNFKGHLGDQDFYTLLSFEYPDWFFQLPCSWNRQLCKWWKYNGYNDVFHYYNDCKIPHHIVHGNCKTKIPVNEKLIGLLEAN